MFGKCYRRPGICGEHQAEPMRNLASVKEKEGDLIVAQVTEGPSRACDLRLFQTLKGFKGVGSLWELPSNIGTGVGSRSSTFDTAFLRTWSKCTASLPVHDKP